MISLTIKDIDDDQVQFHDGPDPDPPETERGKVIVIPDPVTRIPVIVMLTAAQANRWGAILQGKKPIDVFATIPGSGNGHKT